MSALEIQKHDIGSWPRNATLARSDGRGWRNIHAALIRVDTWTGVLPALGNPCLGYCVSHPARIRRRVSGNGSRENEILRPRQFHLIPACEESEWQRHGRSEMLTLHLRQDCLNSAARRIASEHRSKVELDLPLGTSDPLLEQIAFAALDLLKQPADPGAALYVDELAQAMAAHLVRRYTVGGRTASVANEIDTLSSPGIRRIREFIEDHIAEDLSLEALALEARLSARSLSRTFIRHFGSSVHQYVLSRRIEKAKSLLISTDRTIVEIALETGFASQSHLATALRKATGMTPRAYRAVRD